MAAERDRAERAAAAAAERARLARVVHDGVLQVLALVQRRGAELGGDAAELGRLAGEQEAGAAGPDPPAGRAWPPCRPGDLDLAPSWRGWRAARRVTWPRPARPVLLPARSGRRAGGGRGRVPGQRRGTTSGDDAPAWVLLEELAGPGRGLACATRGRASRAGASRPRPPRAGWA